jgi:hypothetical protein
VFFVGIPPDVVGRRGGAATSFVCYRNKDLKVGCIFPGVSSFPGTAMAAALRWEGEEEDDVV